MIRNLVFGAVAVSFSFSFAVEANAQRNYLSSLYGAGVHYYFAGDFASAEAAFNQALELGSTDPRVYYFRGLTRNCMGGDTFGDFQQGAMLEAQGTARSYPISRSLQRIQGPCRIQLERTRANARLMVRQQQQQRNMQRFGTQAPGEVVPGKATDTGENDTPQNLPDVSDVDDPTVPFSDSTPPDAGGGNQPPAEQPQNVPPPAEQTPPSDPPADPPAGDADDPFGGDGNA